MVKSFKIASFAFELEVLEGISLPLYKGSTFRGGFGYAFKKTVCALKSQTCDDCLLREKCVYSYVFETPPPADSAIMRKYPKAPHPFIIEPPEESRRLYAPGEKIACGLTLIGRAIDYLPYFIYSFDMLGKMGIGKGKGKFALKGVRAALPEAAQESREEKGPELLYDGETKKLKMAPLSLTWDDLIQGGPVPDRLTLHFHTPTRIRYNGRYTLDLEFHVLIRNLLRRISTLAYFHCGERLQVQFKALIDLATQVVVDNRSLGWWDWERYSARQDTRLKMGGFVGEVSFRGDLDPFWPFLLLGEVIHVGKGTAFGLGRYTILRG